MSKPALGRNLARLLDGEPVVGGTQGAAPEVGDRSTGMAPALTRLVEGREEAAPVPQPVETPVPPPLVPRWYWFALDILLLVVAEILVLFGGGLPGWIKWPVVLACVIAGCVCALWALLQNQAPSKKGPVASLGRVIFD